MNPIKKLKNKFVKQAGQQITKDFCSIFLKDLNKFELDASQGWFPKVNWVRLKTAHLVSFQGVIDKVQPVINATEKLELHLKNKVFNEETKECIKVIKKYLEQEQVFE